MWRLLPHWTHFNRSLLMLWWSSWARPQSSLLASNNFIMRKDWGRVTVRVIKMYEHTRHISRLLLHLSAFSVTEGKQRTVWKNKLESIMSFYWEAFPVAQQSAGWVLVYNNCTYPTNLKIARVQDLINHFVMKFFSLITIIDAILKLGKHRHDRSDRNWSV